jgi:hypothetical protein
LARQCLDQNVERPRSGESVSLNHTRMHAYKFAAVAALHAAAAPTLLGPLRIASS